MEKKQSSSRGAVSGQRPNKRKAMSTQAAADVRAEAPPPPPPKMYRGVRMRSWGKWVSEIRQPKKRSRIWLGSYSTPEAAATAYDIALYYLRGPYAAINFPASIPPHPPPPDVSAQEVQRAANRAGLAVDKQLGAANSNGSVNTTFSVDSYGAVSFNGVPAANEIAALCTSPSPEPCYKRKIELRSPLPELCCSRRTDGISSPSPSASPSSQLINDSSRSPSPQQAPVPGSVPGKPRPMLKLDLNVAMALESSDVEDDGDVEEAEQASSSNSTECRNSTNFTVNTLPQNWLWRPSADMKITADRIDAPDSIVNSLNFCNSNLSFSCPNSNFCNPNPNSESPNPNSGNSSPNSSSSNFKANCNPNFSDSKHSISSSPNPYFSNSSSKFSNTKSGNPSL